MTVEELTRRWAERHRFANFHPWLSIVDDRVEFGAGQVLARIGRTRGGEIDLFFAGGESAGRARLAVAYMRPITDRQINALRRAARGWAEGERPLAMIGLAQAHLGKFDDPRLCSYRVYMADHLLGEPGFSPRDLLKGLGLEEPQPREAVEKFNPDEPRVPKGNPDGGQWTSEGGGGPGASIAAAAAGAIAARPAGLFSDLGAQALRDLGAFAARTAAAAAGSAALALGLIVIPSQMGGGPVQGAVPGRPDVSYTWTPDEGTLVLSRAVDGQSVPFQSAQLAGQGIYYDAAGDPIARFVNGQLIIDPNAIAMDSAGEASPEDSQALAVGDTRAKPPPGSKPIDETDWSGDHTGIKGALGLGGLDKVKISPDGDFWVENPDGSWTNEGHGSGMTPKGKPTGRRGKDRDRRR